VQVFYRWNPIPSFAALRDLKNFFARGWFRLRAYFRAKKESIMAEPRIEMLAEKKLVGKRMRMSFSGNKTFELWRSFMPRRKEIQNRIGTELYSAEVYPPQFFDRFDPEAEFEKWASVEVEDFDRVPDDMETLVFPSGLYAVFLHKGPASEGTRTYQYIFSTWLPHSAYQTDDRPHFAVMGEKYTNDDPDSEEEIWIPVKLKT
jgi:AraC family transcriptional regulator